jgi:hypothetical protein
MFPLYFDKLQWLNHMVINVLISEISFDYYTLYQIQYRTRLVLKSMIETGPSYAVRMMSGSAGDRCRPQ